MNPSRTCILIFLICCNAVCAFSQRSKPGETYYAFDKNWKAISDIEKATYFTRTKKVSDTCWMLNSYNVLGPMISKELYKDKDQKIAHGRWIFYNPDGYIDSICTFRDNLAHGEWYYLDSTSPYTQKDFVNGRLVKVHARVKKIDSAKNAGKEPELKEGEEESRFPGAEDAWAKYLGRNLEYPQRAINANIGGMVVVQFIVDAEGVVRDIEIYKSVEFSLDEESIRMMIKSPRWIPAVQDGRKVKSYKRQPIKYGLRG